MVTIGPPKHKVEYARYLYPIMDNLKDVPWYAFSKTPEEIEQRITRIVQYAKGALGQDVSRQDGMQSLMFRVLQKIVLETAFPHEDAKRATKLHAKMRGLRVFSSMEFMYFLLLAQASGLMDTSSFNTINMAYQFFRTLRNLSYTRQQAWDLMIKFYLGGGDDSLFGVKDQKIEKLIEAADRAAKSLGQKMTVATFARGSPFDFFARWYSPSTWEGSPNSCSDIGRCFSKLTSSTPGPLGPLVKLEQKLTSLSLTDRNTPGIKEIIDTWLSLGGKLTLKDERAWWGQYGESVQFTNIEEDWMLGLAKTQGLDIGYLQCQLLACCSKSDLLDLEPVFPLLPAKKLPFRTLIVDGDQGILVMPDKPLSDVERKPEVYDNKKAQTAAKVVSNLISSLPKGKEPEENQHTKKPAYPPKTKEDESKSFKNNTNKTLSDLIVVKKDEPKPTNTASKPTLNPRARSFAPSPNSDSNAKPGNTPNTKKSDLPIHSSNAKSVNTTGNGTTSQHTNAKRIPGSTPVSQKPSNNKPARKRGGKGKSNKVRSPESTTTNTSTKAAPVGSTQQAGPGVKQTPPDKPVPNQ